VNSDPVKTSSTKPESDEPRALRPPVPIWLFPILLVMLFWGMVYFDSHGGWFDPVVYAPYPDRKTLEVWQPLPVGDDLFALGRAVYNRPTCVTCHQADGNGTPGQFPPLVGSDWVKEPDPGRIIRIVLNGLNGPITVNGKQFNGTMVPWRDTLSDREIAAVLTYVRQNKEWGHKFPAVKPEQVTAVRTKIASRSQPFTPDELLKTSAAE
jgi:mono/diheme cytochrome c family protein